MKLMVCGSRTITDRKWVFEQIDTCVKENNFTDITIIEGEAKGVDKLAEAWASRHSIPIEKYPANWELYGKSAGYRRNVDMVNACDFCLILWDNESKGTKHDIDLCKKSNKPHKVVLI